MLSYNISAKGEIALVETMSHLNALGAEQAGQWERAIKYMLLLILHRRPAEEHQELVELSETRLTSPRVYVNLFFRN